LHRHASEQTANNNCNSQINRILRQKPNESSTNIRRPRRQKKTQRSACRYTTYRKPHHWSPTNYRKRACIEFLVVLFIILDFWPVQCIDYWMQHLLSACLSVSPVQDIEILKVSDIPILMASVRVCDSAQESCAVWLSGISSPPSTDRLRRMRLRQSSRHSFPVAWTTVKTHVCSALLTNQGHLGHTFSFGIREFSGITGNCYVLNNSRREIPRISEIMLGITKIYKTFVIFIVDYDILVYTVYFLTRGKTQHYVHDAIFQQALNWLFDPILAFLDFEIRFKCRYQKKISEQRQ